MLAYIVRRLIGAVLVLLVITAMVFIIFYEVPKLGGASSNDLAARYVGKSATQEQIEAAAEKLGLNDPIYVQYGNFLKGLFAGEDYDTGVGTDHCSAPCLGYSFQTQQPVLPDLMSRLPVTFSLAIGAAVIWLTLGVGTGVLSALRKGTVFDRAAMGVALAGVSLPIFFTGLLSLSVLSYRFGWFPGGGSYTPFHENPLNWAYDLFLPWVTLAFLYAALYARLTRAGVLETMNEDYIRTARAKGLPEKTVIGKHVMRSVLTPVLTTFGLDIGVLLGGAVLTETTYSLPGLGSYTVQALGHNDLPKLLGVTLLLAIFVVFANLIVDVLYAVVDPRVRL
ncbi:ABC transporter permease [Spongisporangium articulatum]|uniref:ABC transporter permease n=1 Tax=Spongisporangium articulatum TaxID=3362603 RepID=A0ABW8AMB0_9ACTN